MKSGSIFLVKARILALYYTSFLFIFLQLLKFLISVINLQDLEEDRGGVSQKLSIVLSEFSKPGFSISLNL